MNIKKQFDLTRPSSSKIKNPKGFALIATISVMTLLVMIALAMLSLSTIEIRQSQSSNHQATAQANARMALMLAIGDIQSQLGPDTRVSATASMIGSENQTWLGVWKTRPDEDPTQSSGSDHHVIDYHDASTYLSDSRSSSNGTKPTAEAWLVSRSKKISPDELIPADEKITLLLTDDVATTVTVPFLKLGDDGSRIAYWVGDQSQKAILSQIDPYASEIASTANASKEAFYRLLGVQSPYFENFKSSTGQKSFEGLAANDERGKLASYGSAALLDVASPPSSTILKNHFHDLALTSTGLYTNVLKGGLKYDLTAYLEGGDVAAETSLQLPALSDNSPIISSPNHIQTSPRFGALREWRLLADKVSATSGNGSISLQSPQITTMSLAGKWATGQERDLTNVTTPSIQPIVVEASLGWDWSPYPAGVDVDGNPLEKLRAHIYPRLILWNPYNVTLKTSRYSVALRIPTYGSFRYRNGLLKPMRDGKETPKLHFDLNASMPNGKPTRGMLGFVTEDTEIAPGECLIFTPDADNSLGAKLHGKAARLNTQDYTQNVLTSQQVPGIENFYVDTSIALDIAETAGNKYSTYGYSSNLNSFYSTSQGSDLFVVSQIPNTFSSSITWDKFKTFSRISHFIAQNSGLNSYSKWYDAQGSLHASNGGGYFREFKPGAPDVGALDNRRQPRLWRRGFRMVWYNDRAESQTLSNYSPSRVSLPLVASSNLRGGLIYHNNWLETKFHGGWRPTTYSSHIHFQQPPNPSDYRNNYPPSPINDPAFGFPERVCLYDIPRQDTGIISMAQFQHAQLSYMPWHPSYIIGHSLSTHAADLDHTALLSSVDRTDRWQTGLGNKSPNFGALIQNSAELLIYDIAYEVNHRLWDSYFLSTVPYSSGTFAWDGKTTLPYSPCTALASGKDMDDSFITPAKSNHSYAFHHGAEYLVNIGAFNINSTSVVAWKAILSSLHGQIRPSLTGGDNADDYSFSRFVLPLKAGSSTIGDVSEEEAQAGFRKLTESEIQTLAENIVLEVKKRGPFLSMSDFINRRLQPGSSTSTPADDYKDPARMGTLQAAIEASGLNANLRQDDGDPTTFDDDAVLNDTSKIPSHNNRPAFKSYGLPGYLMQGDLLTTLAPRITARGDTFVVRAYGDAKNKKGSVVARAWCEATVQRLPVYLDSTNDAATPPRVLNGSGQWVLNPDLLSVNRKFGRRLVVTSFRWLSRDEVGTL